MNDTEPSITIDVDPTNPGQFFACCGLLELADRLWPGAEGWFDDDHTKFHAACDGTLPKLLGAARSVSYSNLSNQHEDDDGDEEAAEEEGSTVQPLDIISPVRMRLDWWTDRSIKTWAGSMKVDLIAAAMSGAIDHLSTNPLNQAQVVFDPPKSACVGTKKASKTKKREPFYFDCRRATNSHSLDVGFSANDLKLKTIAYPVVEFFCLIGLQRCRPVPTSRPRILEYATWSWRCPISLLSAACTGIVPDKLARRLRFENAYRSGQKKHKTFRPAVLLN